MSLSPSLVPSLFWLVFTWVGIQIIFRCWLIPVYSSSSSSSSSPSSSVPPSSQFDANAYMVSVTTTKGTDAIYRLSQPVRKFLRWLYQVGVYVGVVCFFLSLFALGYCLLLSIHGFANKVLEDPANSAAAMEHDTLTAYEYEFARAVSSEAGPSGAVAIAIPGLTIPLSHAFYFVGAVVVSVLIHELGHAMAAAAYGVHAESITMFLAMVFPGAYVALPDFDGLSIKARLQIASAGVWHNLMLSLVCVLLLWNPGMVLGVSYSEVKDGVYVAESNELLFQNQLIPGDRVMRLDDIAINADNWAEVLYNMTDPSTPQYQLSGRCVMNYFVEHHSEDVSCCNYGLEENGGLAVQCFEYSDTTKSAERGQTCMSAKEVLGAFDTRCRSNADCKPNQYGDEFTCVHMKLDESYERLILLTVEGGHHYGEPGVMPRGNMSNVVFFVGYPLDILRYVRAVPYAPRPWWSAIAPRTLVNIRMFPFYMDTFLRYVFSISTSIALLNSAPIMHSDGMHSIELYVTVLHSLKLKWAHWEYTQHIINICTAVTALNVILSMLIMIL